MLVNIQILEPIHVMYWNNVGKFADIYFGVLEPIHVMYWNSIKSLSGHLEEALNRYMWCIEIIWVKCLKMLLQAWTDTCDVLKSLITPNTSTIRSLEPIHVMYWNVVSFWIAFNSLRLEPIHVMYWNSGFRSTKHSIEATWTDTCDVLKYITSIF